MTLPRPLRIGSIVLTAVLALAVAGGAVFAIRFDPDSLKPALIEAVRQATGRDLALNGPIRLKFSPRPGFRATDVAFANPPGFSRPDMATVQSMDVQIGLLPLLSGQIRIDRLILIRPDIRLETTASGNANWRTVPAHTAPRAQIAPSVVPTTPRTEHRFGRIATTIAIDTLVIQDGMIAYRDDAAGKSATFAISQLKASAATPDSAIQLDADAIFNGTAFNVAATTGSLTGSIDQSAAAPWPVRLALTAGTAKLTADGSVSHPLQPTGYDLAVAGNVPDTAILTLLMQGYALPPLHDVTFSARIAGTGSAPLAISALVLHAGAQDLNAYVAGLTLIALDIDAPGADQPMKIAAAAKAADTPITIAGTLGSPTLLMPYAKMAPFPVDLKMQAGGAAATATGTIADIRAMTGAKLTVAAQVPNLSALSRLARHPLPDLKSLAFHAALSDPDGGFQHGVALSGLTLAGPDGDVSGDVRLGFGPRPSLTAAIVSTRIDLDAIAGALNRTQTAAPDASPGATPPPQPAVRHGGTRLFSTDPLPFDLLRTADADLSLKIAVIRSDGADYKSIDAHAVLSGGKLTVDPFAAELPGGHLTATLSADAATAEPPVHLTLRAPGLALKTILAAAQQPPYATGTMEVYADLGGTGTTPHAIAASLDGFLGLAVTAGTLDNRLLGSLLGTVNPSLSALDLVRNGGTTSVRCFGLRAEAHNGTGTLQALALSSSLLTMTGGGTVDLGAETLAMTLRPRVRIGGTGVVIPVALSGPIREPAAKVSELTTAEAGAAIAAGILNGDRADVCPPALAAARGLPVPEPAPSKAAPSGAPDPAALLKKLFR